MESIYSYVNPVWPQGKFILFQPEVTKGGLHVKKQPTVEFLIPIPGSVVIFQGDIGRILVNHPGEFLKADCDVMPETSDHVKIYKFLHIV
jgi:hypothetical protein